MFILGQYSTEIGNISNKMFKDTIIL